MRPPAVHYSDSPQQLPVVHKPKERQWSFSLRYWKQIKYFGLDRTKPDWFVSLMEKLQDLCKYSISTFKEDTAFRTAQRVHKVDWDQKNIPIQRKKLAWLHPDYLDNEEDYPLYQFQISKALGRVVGFFDEEDVFNIVLLDPHHNIQPSKFHNYRVDPCSILNCQYTSLLNEIDNLKTQKTCGNGDCNLQRTLLTVPTNLVCSEVLLHFIGSEDLEQLEELQSRENISATEIFQFGIHFYDEDTGKQ